MYARISASYQAESRPIGIRVARGRCSRTQRTLFVMRGSPPKNSSAICQSYQRRPLATGAGGGSSIAARRGKDVVAFVVARGARAVLRVVMLRRPRDSFVISGAADDRPPPR